MKLLIDNHILTFRDFNPIRLRDERFEFLEFCCYFRYLDYEVETASNGREAMEKLAQSSRTQVVISDIKMPEMDGIAFLRAVQKKYPMVHTIIMTGYGTDEDEFACDRYGADAFVYKPVDMSLLERAVKKAIASVKHEQFLSQGFL